MAHSRSAIKRHRQSLVRRTRNRAEKTKFRNAIKRAIASVADGGDGEGSAEALRHAQSSLDRAASKKVIHRNTASRRTSRLARRLHKASSAAE